MLTLYFSTICHQRSRPGVSGVPSYMTDVVALASGPVDDVAVPGHPADVGRRPEDVGLGLDVEDEPVGGRDMGQVAAARVEDALRLGRRAAGVHDVERLLGVEGLGLVGLGLARHQVVPPDVAGLVPRDVLAGPPDDQHTVDVGALLHGLVDRRLQGARPRPGGSRRRR